MKIAIISDIHENLNNLVLAIEQIKKHQAGQIIFLGDFINNGVAKMLAGLSMPVFAVWGNNDGDKVAIIKTALSENSNLTMGMDTFDILKIDNRKIFITHFPMLAKPMAKSGDFDAVFYGHNHLKNKEKINDCLVLNPGEISAHKTGISSFAIYNTETNKGEIYEVEEKIISTKNKMVDNYRKKIGFEYSKAKSHQY